MPRPSDSDLVRSSVHSRTLGDELAVVRAKARLASTRLAEKIGWSISRVAHVERGSRNTNESDVAYYLGMCDASPEAYARVMALYRQLDNDCLMQNHEPGLPDEVRTLIRHESTAISIWNYESMILPGLLQTSNYAQALILRSANLGAGAVDLRVRARMSRQSMLHRQNAPECVFYIHEAALRTLVGSHRVMEDQLMHLVLLTNWRKIVIRVVPFSAHGASWLRGQFMIMDYQKFRSVVYVEQEISSLFLDDPAPVATYRLMVERLDEVALDGEQSQALLAELAGNYYDSRGADDDDPTGGPELA